VRHRAFTSVADSGPVLQRKAGIVAARAPMLLLGLVALWLGGCSVSVPLGAMFGADEPTAPTGTIKGASDANIVRLQGQPSLSPQMDAEDARRSQSALALALDPAGNGVPVGWDNPQSGNKGSFRSVSEFYLEGNQLCRRFVADFTTDSQASGYDGSACRAGPQSWVIIEAKAQDSKGTRKVSPSETTLAAPVQ
jgi:surface antigen